MNGLKAVFLVLFMASFCHGQFVPLSEMYETRLKPGQHLVLVSAEWCEPCKVLKQRLSNLKTKVHVIDWDKDKTKAKKFLKNQPMPQLIRYHVGSDGRVISGVYFKPSENLNDFVRQQKTILLKTELLEIKKQLERLIKTHGP